MVIAVVIAVVDVDYHGDDYNEFNSRSLIITNNKQSAYLHYLIEKSILKFFITAASSRNDTGF